MKPDDLPTSANPTVAKPNPDKQPATTTLWFSFAKLIATLGSIGGVLLHLIGYISYLSYMSAWGLESGPFHKDIDEVLFMGYLAIMDGSNHALSLIGGHVWAILVVWLSLTAYAFLIFRQDKSDTREKAKQIFQRLPNWVPDLLGSVLGSTLTLALFPIGLLFVLVVTTLPVSIGDSFGRSLADSQYKKSLPDVSMSLKVIVVLKSGKTEN